MKESILKILKDRYFLKDETEWEHIAKRISAIYPEIYDDIKNMNFIPSSPTLMNANTKERIGTLSSCFPMGKIDDSINGIFDAVKECAEVTRMGGGVGYDFSTLRGSNEGIKGLGGRKSSGPLQFINIFNSVLDGVQQGGARRGAGMSLLDISHPDILKFIDAKLNLNQFNRFNFSIKIGNDFYEKLQNTPNAPHIVKNISNGLEYSLQDDNGNIVTVKQLWEKILNNAWLMAEPGIFNKDIAYEQCTTKNISDIVICNPCSEFVHIPYTSCALGSINLSNLVEDKIFNWDKFEQLIIKATRFINNTLDVNNFPIKEIKKVTLSVRPIGLGFMGLAHALFKMGIAYNSEEGLKFAEEMSLYLTICSMNESMKLATIDKNGAYPEFDYDTFMDANKRFFKYKKIRNIDINKLKEDIKEYGIRNSSQTSIAPTGTLSTIAETSSGIEPIFALTYMRKVEQLDKKYDIMYITDTIFEKYLDDNFSSEQKLEILKQVSDNKGSCQKCNLIPDEMKKVFITAGDLTPTEHLNMLEVVAQRISLAISKTINLPNSITKEEMGDVFIDAYKRGIIGVTVYRDGCREGILVHKESKEINRPTSIEYHSAPKRPKELPCAVHRVNAMVKNDKGEKSQEKFIIFVGLFEGKPYEFFVGKIEDVAIPKTIENGFLVKIKSGQYAFKHDDEILIQDINKTFHSDEYSTFSRLVSSLLRHGGHPKYVIDQLNKCPGTIVDFSKAVTRMLKNYILDGEEADTCKECGSKKIYISGCKQCPVCGIGDCG